jgi:hypothetical protein
VFFKFCCAHFCYTAVLNRILKGLLTALSVFIVNVLSGLVLLCIVDVYAS